LIFSIEDDLDYAIAMDPYLYGRYESSVAAMLEIMSTLDIDQIFEQVKNELTPFYYNKEVIFQSQFDEHETSFKLWEENMAEKKAMLKERLSAMKEQLKDIQP
jgi:uncharacterized protein (DUF2164 family)